MEVLARKINPSCSINLAASFPEKGAFTLVWEFTLHIYVLLIGLGCYHYGDKHVATYDGQSPLTQLNELCIPSIVSPT